MNSEQKFDRIFHDKVEGGENSFPFNDAEWESARKMIDAERGATKSTSKSIVLLSAMLLLVGTGTFLTYHFIDKDNNLALSNRKQESSGNETGSDLSNVYINESKNISENNSATTTAERSEYSPESDGMSNSLKGTGIEKNSIDVISGDVKAEGGNSSFPAKSGQASGKVNNTISKSEKNNSSALKTSSKKSNSISKSEPFIANSAAKSDYEIYENSENAFWLAGKITSLPKHKMDSSLVKTAFDFIRVYDADYYKAKRRKTHYLNIEGGMAYLMGWDAPKGKDAKGFNVYAGFNIGTYLGKKSSISAGLQVYNIGNIQQPFFNGSNVSYDFGANGTYTVISGRSLYYTAIPLHFNYSLKGTDRISIGVNTGILCGGVNTEETFTMQDGIKMNSQTNKVLGFYEGMNPVNVMLTAGYGRNLNKRMRINAEFVYGLSDIYKSSKFNNTRENVPGIRIGMQYTLSDK